MLSVLIAFTAIFLVTCALLSLFIERKTFLSSSLLALAGFLLCSIGIGCWSQHIKLEINTCVAFGWLPLDLRCDTLSGCFTFLLGLLCTACGFYSSGYIKHLSSRLDTRLYWSLLFLFVFGMYILLMAGNAITFLSAWEVMSLSSFALVASDYRRPKAQKAAFIYLVATRLATMLLMAGFLLMANTFNSLQFTNWNFGDHSSRLAAALILLGLIVKSGVWPFHLWLPYAHSEAPSPVSSLMSGLMVKLPVYAAIRFFVFGQLNCDWLAYTLLILATITAFWGVLFALNQRDLKRLLAYSTVENVGLIYVAMALCLIAQSSHLTGMGQIALIAMLLHTAFHALIKSLLFLCAGSVDLACGTKDMSKLGGVGKTMPLTFAGFLVGSASICSLPPFNGFVSKWCIYRALFESTLQLQTVFGRGLCLALVAILGTVGALAVACFVKAIGVTFLGKPRSARASNAQEVKFWMAAPQLLIAGTCLITGLVAPNLTFVLEPLCYSAGFGHIANNLFDSIPLRPVALTIVAVIAIVYCALLRVKPRAVKTWDCGFGTTSLRSQVSADSFAQPIARIFRPILQHHLVVDISGHDRRHFPERIHVTPSMVSLLETKVYAPIGRRLQSFSEILAKLQAGSIHLYLLYVCAALVVLLTVGAWL